MTEEPIRKRGVRGRGERAAGDQSMTAAVAVDAAVARALGAGIYPKNSHKFRGASPRRTPLHTRSRGPLPPRSARMARALRALATPGRSPDHASEASISFSSMSAFV